MGCGLYLDIYLLPCFTLLLETVQVYILFYILTFVLSFFKCELESDEKLALHLDTNKPFMYFLLGTEKFTEFELK